ncbi:hypothetical protein KC220_23930, partial [Mycobacterium tuberculosis]|nr:hypothetical protein [Mycobacterium tuberculosis]
MLLGKIAYACHSRARQPCKPGLLSGKLNFIINLANSWWLSFALMMAILILPLAGFTTLDTH